MEIIINPNILQAMLKIISGAVCINKKNDIFSHVLMKKIEKKLFCIAINEEMEIVTYQELEQSTTHSIDIIIKYEVIYNICKMTKNDDKITIIKTKNSIEVKTHNSFFRLPLLYSTDFPSLQSERKALLTIKTNVKDLQQLLCYSYNSTSETTQNTFLKGILIDINKNCVTAVSSDGFKLAFSQILHHGLTQRIKIIIPKILIKEFLNIYKENENIYLMISDNYIKIINNKITLTTRLINDIYDDINIKTLSKKLTNSFVKTSDFKKALYTLNSICDNNNMLTLNIKYDKIIILANFKSEHGAIEIKAKTEGEKIEITLNHKHLTNILRIITSDDLEIIITEKKKYIILKEKNINCMHIITPFNT